MPPPSGGGIRAVIGGVVQLVGLPSYARWYLPLSLFPHIDSGSIQRILEVRRVIRFDHLDTGPAVLRHLIDVGALHQPEADVGVSQAVSSSLIAVAINF